MLPAARSHPRPWRAKPERRKRRARPSRPRFASPVGRPAAKLPAARVSNLIAEPRPYPRPIRQPWFRLKSSSALRPGNVGFQHGERIAVGAVAAVLRNRQGYTRPGPPASSLKRRSRFAMRPAESLAQPSGPIPCHGRAGSYGKPEMKHLGGLNKTTDVAARPEKVKAIPP